MPQGGDREAYLPADYNAEMLEHIERFPRVRDRAIFVGDPDDIVGGTFGPGLPSIRSWTQRHFEFSGYITGIDPIDISNRAELRHRFGYGDEEKVCVVTVGGSAVGAALLQRVIDSTPAVRRMLPEMRFVIVAGPRINPASLPNAAGVEVYGYVTDSHLRLAACHIA